jgi:hypothetical protein
MGMGASITKWTIPHPYLVLSERDSKLYINFDFCEKKVHRHFKNILIYKAEQFIMTKNNFKKSLHILEDNASGLQVDDIEQVIL